MLVAWAIPITWRITLMGMGLTRFGGGSSRLYAAHMRCNLKSIFPLRLWRGSGAPTLASVCPIARMAPSKVRALTLSPLGAISPDLYLTAKICSSAMGSESCESRGSMANSTQNERHRPQWPAVALSVEEHTPVLTQSRAMSRSATAAAARVGSKVARRAAVDILY